MKGRPGRATTSIDGWNADSAQVGAPYLVDRDGTIYQTFNDAEWIYHLGLKGTDGAYDRASVAIEFANELALTLDGDRLHAFGMNTPNTVYTGPFLQHDWRGSHHFAQLDEAQVDAGIEFTLDVCRRHGIYPVFFCPSTSFDFPRCFSWPPSSATRTAARTSWICVCRSGCTRRSGGRGSRWRYEGAGALASRRLPWRRLAATLWRA